MQHPKVTICRPGFAEGYPFQSTFMQELYELPTYPTNSNKPLKIYRMTKQEFAELVRS